MVVIRQEVTRLNAEVAKGDATGEGGFFLGGVERVWL